MLSQVRGEDMTLIFTEECRQGWIDPGCVFFQFKTSLAMKVTVWMACNYSPCWKTSNVQISVCAVAVYCCAIFSVHRPMSQYLLGIVMRIRKGNDPALAKQIC
jgi:hypothetical protein